MSGSRPWPIVYLSKSLAYVCQVFDIRNEFCYNRFRWQAIKVKLPSLFCRVLTGSTLDIKNMAKCYYNHMKLFFFSNRYIAFHLGIWLIHFCFSEYSFVLSYFYKQNHTEPAIVTHHTYPYSPSFFLFDQRYFGKVEKLHLNFLLIIS